MEIWKRIWKFGKETRKNGETEEKKNKMAKKQKGLLALAVILAALLLAFGLYFGNYYHADKTAQQAMKSSRTVKVKQTAEGYLFDESAKKNAIIFYPGAKVETTAYAPLLKQIASQEADVFLVAMPPAHGLLRPQQGRQDSGQLPLPKIVHVGPLAGGGHGGYV